MRFQYSRQRSVSLSTTSELKCCALHSSFDRISQFPSSRRRASLSRSLPHGRTTHRTMFPIQRAISEDFERATELGNGTTEKFDWFKNWWPVQAIGNLKTDRPNKIQLLGNDYIVWKGHSGDWITMDDECPHRMAPLSEGRIEKDGNLLCSYHAWRFNEQGKCVKIPHAEDEKAHSIACNSPRSAVQTYPCVSRGSVLWIWPNRSQNAQTDSEKEPIPMDDDIADFFEKAYEKGTFYPYVRYLPYSFEALMENLVDPAHFLVSHHGLVPGISRYNACCMHVRPSQGMGQRPAFAAIDYDPYVEMYDWSHLAYRKPGATFICHGMAADSSPSDSYYLVAAPITSDRSFVLYTALPKSSANQHLDPNPFKTVWNSMMLVYQHVAICNPLFDGDSIFIHEQDKKIRKKGFTFQAKKDYYIPTTADTLVMAFRKWFETEGRRGKAYQKDSFGRGESELSRTELLDRYGQHTKHCKICSRALRVIKIVNRFLKILSLTTFVIAGLLVEKRTRVAPIQWIALLKSVSLWSITLICIATFSLHKYLSEKLIPCFYFQDSVHADKD